MLLYGEIVFSVDAAFIENAEVKDNHVHETNC